MAIGVEQFGSFAGKPVEQFKLTSATGVEVDIISWGVAVRSWRVPVASGGKRDVVLGFQGFDAYPEKSPHFGSLAGRVANRISGASFSLDGVTYTTPANWNGITLHGGPEGLGRINWQGKADEASNSVTFTHTSPDGHMGFPGKVEFTARYTLDGNRLNLLLTARADKRTPINIVQHQYFNLGTTDNVLDHTYQVAGSAYTELGENLVPTGVILPVKGTDWDLRQPRTMRDANGNPVDYDGNVVLDTGRDPSLPAAIVTAPDNSLTLKLWTDRPGLQVYNSVWSDVSAEGRHWGRYSGFCLEDQDFPDAVNNPHFPSIIYGPGHDYTHTCDIEIA
jgi:aldose 1-epimerase